MRTHAELTQQLHTALHDLHFFGTRPVARNLVMEATESLERATETLHTVHATAEAALAGDADQIRHALQQILGMTTPSA